MRNEILRMNHIIYSPEPGHALITDLSLQVFECEIYGILHLDRHGGKELIELIEWNRPILGGQVYFQDRLVNNIEKGDGSRNKVAVISHESRLIDCLSLADNIFVIRPGFRKFHIRESVLLAQTTLLLEKYGIRLSPHTLASELNTYERLVTELLRAVVAGEPLILLQDIPDLLGSEELANFHRLMGTLVQDGITLIYIYNHHEALMNICDRIAIFHGTRVVKVVEADESVEDHVKVLAKQTIDEISKLTSPQKSAPLDRPYVLRFDHVFSGGLNDFSMALSPGEIVLLLDRNNTVLGDLLALFGRINQKESITGVTAPKPRKDLRIGIVQRSPILATLFQDLSFVDNLCFSLGEKVPGFWSKSRYLKSVIREYWCEFGDMLQEKQLYDLHTQELYSLVYSRFLLAKPDLVVCYQPLSGQDMYLRPHILKLILKLRNANISVLILSTDYYDMINIADRILSIDKGRVNDEITQDEFSKII